MEPTSSPQPPGHALLVLEGEPYNSYRFLDEAVPVLRSRGVEPIVASVFDTPPLEAKLSELGARSHPLGCRSARDYAPAAVRLAMAARRLDSPIIQGTAPIAAAIAGAAARLARRRGIYHRQAISLEDLPQLDRLSRLANRLCHATLACSEATRQAAISEGVSPDRTYVSYNAGYRFDVAAADVDAARASLALPPGTRVVLAIARLRHVKGIDVLVRAMAHVTTSEPVALVVVGDGPDRAALEDLAAAEGGVPVRFVGHQDQVGPWLEIADLLAVPSRMEAFGVVAAEAMSSALPVVASDVDGLREVVVHGETGLLVPPEDPGALAAAIAQVLVDRQLGLRLGSAGRDRFEARFTTTAMVDAWVRCWSDLV